MSNEQLYMAIGVPILFNGIVAVMLSTLFAGRLTDLRGSVEGRFGDLRATMDGRFGDLRSYLDVRLTSIEGRISSIESRMATKEELRRVEEVLDARLRHVEEELAKR